MRRLTTLLAIGVILAILAAACGGGSPTATPRPAAPTATTSTGMADGAQLAAQRGCTACHSTTGSAGAGPTWKGLYGSTRELQDGSTVTADDAYLLESITDPGAKVVKGYGAMPNLGVNTADAQAIIEYIKTLE